MATLQELIDLVLSLPKTEQRKMNRETKIGVMIEIKVSGDEESPYIDQMIIALR